MDNNALEEKRHKIETLGLSALEKFFELDIFENNNEITKALYNKAKLAMQFEKERNTNKRAIEMNHIRIFRLIKEDKNKLQELIKKSIPQYLPAK